ncbi:MAG TPA: hypothetical protein VHW23_28475, partial [Kofleriaceae bacterium]|nr:hypothetical protein [Kofleriaceae bacterium]
MLAALVACRHSSDPVAELSEADGEVQRQEGTAGKWQPAGVHTQYFLRDAAHVETGRAVVDLIGAHARIAMRGGTTVRFNGAPGKLSLSVEAGQIGLTGDGSYQVDLGTVSLGTVNLSNGTIQINPKTDGVASLELTGGKGQVATPGATVVLELNKPRDVGPTGLVVDAGVPDAPAPVIDAGVPDAAPAAGDVTIEVTGRRAELLAPGQIAWKPLPAGAGGLPHGSSVRLGPGTTARLSGGGLTLDLATGARVKLADGDSLGIALEAGGAHAAATGPVGLALPGGAVALGGAAGAAAEARLDTTPRDTKVSVLRGGSKLTGGPGAELAMNRGETALLTRAGAIRVLEAIPEYFDLRVGAGESLTIHDPRPPTAV